MKKITIVGCGNMGGAIARALAAEADIRLSIHDPYKEELPEGALRDDDLSSVKDADIVIIAVKPQWITKEFLSSLYEEKNLSLYLHGKGPAFISIAAGIPLEVLSKAFPHAKVARFMPNIAASAKKSVTAVAFNEEGKKDEAFRKDVMDVAESFGSAFELSESQFGAFIGISGSLIAYALEFVNQSAMGGVNAGIPYPTAAKIVADTLESAAALLRETGKTPAELIPNVCSAAGTTIEGMRALADGGFASALSDAVMRTAEKSDELENNAKERLA